MVWAKLDDEILDNPKIAEAGPLGFALHVAGITWCCRNLTDGFIPRTRVRSLLDFGGVMWDEDNPGAVACQGVSAGGRHGADPLAIAEHLVDVGLWKHDPDGRGYWLHDFLEYNPSREKVLSERDRAKKRRDSTPPEKASPKRPTNVFGSSAERTPNVNRNSDGPDPDPDPDPIEPPSGGSHARARAAGFRPESESKVRLAAGGPVVVGLADPLDDDARAAWETAVMNRKPPDQPIEAVWVNFCGQLAGTEFPSRLKLVGRWQRWVGDECRMSEGRRIEAQDKARRYADHTPKYDKPTPGQTSAFQAELKRRLEEEAKKGAA